jgi:4-aminobutyrate aminotransferase-like enzyme
VAALIAEPLMGEGGILVPPPEYFRIATDIVRARGGLFIADEVQSGFGRTGKLFAIEHYPEVVPDIMTLAKGIANGFPLGAFIARAEIAEAMEPGDHLSTFGGNPVSCAAAVANIDVLQEQKLVENAAARGAQLLARFAEIGERRPLVGDVRGRGLMIGIELVKDRSTKEPAKPEAVAARTALRERGFLVGVGGALGNVVRVQPPLSIGEEDCARLADAIEEVLGEVAPRRGADR